jgi:nicotinamide-nucleotide amidase
MKAEIIATGTELLLGDITDTNTSYIAGQLAMLGIDLYYTSTVGDNYQRLLAALKQAWNRSDLIILTGGLGPTQGDITREVIAGLLGEKPEVDEQLKTHLISLFTRMHIEMTNNNLKQATLIPSASALSNTMGTAPGWWVEKEGRTIIALPGPPGEMVPMWQNQVLPRLEKKSGYIILSRTLKTWGLPESKVDEMVSSHLSSSNPTLAMYAKPDGIQLRITAKAADRDEAALLIAEKESALRNILGDFIWGIDSDTLEKVVGQLLAVKKKTLATAESVTAGFLSYSLACLPGTIEFFKGSITVTSNEARTLLGLKPDAGTETAISMASSVRVKFGADIGIGIDGVIGHGETAMAETAYIAFSLDDKNTGLAQSYTGRPYQLSRRTIQQVLFQLISILQRL